MAIWLPSTDHDELLIDPSESCEARPSSVTRVVITLEDYAT
jgi:hypothetical protein